MTRRRTSVGQALRLGAQLTKLPISLLVTTTCALGYLLCAGAVGPELGWVLLGTVLVAAAASALNHLQDRTYDARMARTAARPLPAGQVRPGTVAVLALALAGLGFAALASLQQAPGAAMGLTALALLWYNGLYAWLKRHTAFAVVPGAGIGSIPPLVGWVAAGGSLADPLIYLVAALIFLWQVPHFWLLVLVHGDDYAAAGLPTLTARFSRPALARITYAWLLATAAAAPGVAALLGAGPFPFALLLVGSLGLGLTAWQLRQGGCGLADCRRAFGRVNVWMLGFVVVLGVSALA